MAEPVDFERGLLKLRRTARKHGHIMMYVGSFTIKKSKKMEHLAGQCGREMWVCTKGDCKAAIMVICSDGTVDGLGPAGIVHRVLDTPEVSYDCGVLPNPLTKPIHIVPGTSTRH